MRKKINSEAEFQLRFLEQKLHWGLCTQVTECMKNKVKWKTATGLLDYLHLAFGGFTDAVARHESVL